MHRYFHRLITAVLFLSASAFAANCAPMMGLGNIQVFDNTGKPLTAGVLYSFQAGTSSQQATFTDSTCTTNNANPIPFTTGARASIWTNTGQFYKFVLCAQNDGSACAAADVLFSVDQVPGNLNGNTGGGGGGSPFTGTFISGSTNPATSGILRLASGDTLCFRNAANSANLCLSKDSNDVVSWASGAFKLPEISCTNTSMGFDYLCADSTAHRWKMANNGGSQIQVVGAGVDINTSDQVTQLHFGAAALPLSGTAPTTNQLLQWNGTNVVGCCILESVVVWCTGGTTCNPAAAFAENSVFAQYGTEVLLTSAHTLTRFTFNLATAQSGCGANAILAVQDVTAASNLATSTLTNGQTTGFVDSGALSVSIPAGHKIMVGTVQAYGTCTTAPLVTNVTAVYQ